MVFLSRRMRWGGEVSLSYMDASSFHLILVRSSEFWILILLGVERYCTRTGIELAPLQWLCSRDEWKWTCCGDGMGWDERQLRGNERQDSGGYINDDDGDGGDEFVWIRIILWQITNILFYLWLKPCLARD